MQSAKKLYRYFPGIGALLPWKLIFHLFPVDGFKPVIALKLGMSQSTTVAVRACGTPASARALAPRSVPGSVRKRGMIGDCPLSRSDGRAGVRSVNAVERCNRKIQVWL